MELQSLAVPVLLASAFGIFRMGHREQARAWAVTRWVCLFAVFAVWSWAWVHTPASLYPAPVWRHLTFAPAATGLLCLLGLETHRIVSHLVSRTAGTAS